MKDTKQKWFKDGRFGLFIHFGLYSILGGEYKGKRAPATAEWIMNSCDIPLEEYSQLAKEFNPVNFDAEKIVSAAKNCGMKYVVFTAKHHDGFALFDSHVSEYNSVKATPCKRDFVREMQKACEKYNLKFCLYYSQAQDWEDPNGFVHLRDNSHKNFQVYLERKCMPQLRELLTNYGEVALLWLDTPMDTTYEQSKALHDMIKELQPECIINGRIGNHFGDYMTTGDNYIPLLPLECDWEVPATINDTWGYSKFDDNWKCSEEIIQKFLKINGRGGNYLLNLGPDGSGAIPPESLEVLDEIRDYVMANEEALFGTSRLPIYVYELDWCIFTTRDYKLYVHIIKPMQDCQILNMGNQIKRAYVVNDGTKVEADSTICCEGDHVVEFSIPEKYRDKTGFCVALELEEKDVIFEPMSDA